MVGQSAIVKNGGTVQGRAEAYEAYDEGWIPLTRTRPAGVIARHSRKLAAAVFASSVALWALAAWARRGARTLV